MTAMMPSVAVHGPDDVRIDQIETPSPGPGDIVVRVAKMLVTFGAEA